MDAISEKIYGYFKSKGLGEVKGDTMLFEKGVLDSFQMVELIVFIEATFLVRFGPSDFTRENLETIDRIISQIKMKSSKG